MWANQNSVPTEHHKSYVSMRQQGKAEYLVCLHAYCIINWTSITKHRIKDKSIKNANIDTSWRLNQEWGSSEFRSCPVAQTTGYKAGPAPSSNSLECCIQISASLPWLQCDIILSPGKELRIVWCSLWISLLLEIATL